MTPDDRLYYATRFTDAQVEALTAYGEARGEPVLGLVAVICVIRTRAKIKKSSSVSEALRPAAFECWLDEPGTNDDTMVALAHTVTALDPTPYNPVLDVCMYLASRKDLRDPTGGATHYLNTHTVRAMPAWTRPPARCTVVIGRQTFYTNVAF